MIKQEAGFCYLASVTGQFRGYGEEVRVFVSGDGWWYLDGKSAKSGVGATAMAIRITNP